MLRVTILIAAACATLFACERQSTPPPATAPLNAPPPATAPTSPSVPPVKSAMWSIAVKTNRLTELLQKPQPLSADDLQQVRTIVDDVAKIAAGLGVDPVAQKHPNIQAGLADFNVALVRAQAGLAKEPPDMTPTAALGASCLACHGVGKSAAPFQL